MGGTALQGVTKRFGDVVVVDNVSLEIAPGEFVVFLGPSGCGKSTLLRMIAGLEAPDAGTISINDRRVDGLPPGGRDVAMVFQHYALYPTMSVRENMAFGLRNVGTSTDEIASRVATAAAMLEIDHLLDRRPAQLSGGQRQRVAIARAIVKKPALFLFDEPLSNLDAALRMRTRIELAQLHSQLGAMMIFVTHDQVEAMTLADRIVVLREGRIEQVGPPMEIYARPATRFVARFVGTPAMNMLSGRLSSAGQFGRFEIAGMSLDTRVQSNALAAGDIELGIRAEHVRVAAQGVAAEVRAVERLGERTLIHAVIGEGQPIIAEDAGTSSVRRGDRVHLAIDGSAAHLFDKHGNAYHAEASP